jgi:ribosomal protein S17E
MPDTKYILIIRNNQGFLLLIENPELYQANKHIVIKYYYIRDKYRHNHITLYYTPITKIITNGLTKPFAKINFRKFIQ